MVAHSPQIILLILLWIFNFWQILVAKSPVAPFIKFIYTIEDKGIVLEGDFSLIDCLFQFHALCIQPFDCFDNLSSCMMSSIGALLSDNYILISQGFRQPALDISQMTKFYQDSNYLQVSLTFAFLFLIAGSKKYCCKNFKTRISKQNKLSCQKLHPFLLLKVKITKNVIGRSLFLSTEI